MSGSLARETLHAFLRDTPLLEALSPSELDEVLRIVVVRDYRPGHSVFVEGDPGDAWFVIYEGEVEVVKRTRTGPKALALLGPKACFGEMAMLDGSPRSASIRACTHVKLLCFPCDAFQAMLDADRVAAFRVVYHLARVLVVRQRRTTHRLGELASADDPHRFVEGGDITPRAADRVGE